MPGPEEGSPAAATPVRQVRIRDVPPDRWKTYLRNARKLSQQEIIDLVNTLLEQDQPGSAKLTQSVLSAWETGLRTPITDRPPFRKLLKVLELASEDGESVTIDSSPSETDVPDLTRSIQSEVRDCLNDNGQVDIWVIGVAQLPILTSHQIRDYWRQNLTQGVNYRIIWLTDNNEQNKGQLRNALIEIGAVLTESLPHHQDQKARFGRIFHYRANMNGPPQKEVEGWFRDSVTMYPGCFAEVEHINKVSNPINVILPSINIDTPDIRLESGAVRVSEIDKTNCFEVSVLWALLKPPIKIAYGDDRYEALSNLLSSWLSLRQQWQNALTSKSSLIIYQFNTSTREYWKTSERRRDVEPGEKYGDVIDVVKTSSDLDEILKDLIEKFRRCYERFLELSHPSKAR